MFTFLEEYWQIPFLWTPSEASRRISLKIILKKMSTPYWDQLGPCKVKMNYHSTPCSFRGICSLAKRKARSPLFTDRFTVKPCSTNTQERISSNWNALLQIEHFPALKILHCRSKTEAKHCQSRVDDGEDNGRLAAALDLNVLSSNSPPGSPPSSPGSALHRENWGKIFF